MWWMLARMAGWDEGTVIQPGTWLGLTTDWNDDANWPVEIPTITTDVIISSSALNQPYIFDSPTAICKNLTINSGASLTIIAGQSLTVSGNLSNSGTLSIESGISNADPVGLTLNGSLIVNGASTGKVTYNRILRPKGTFGDRHFFSSPVTGQTIAGFISENVNRPQIWEWYEFDGTWPAVTTGSFASGKGYNLAQTEEGSGSYVFNGSMVSSALITTTAPYYSEAQHYTNERGIWGGGGWNLLGNPFTSSMRVADENFDGDDGNSDNDFITKNVTSFDPNYLAVYVYDGTDGEHGTYYYIAKSVPFFDPFTGDDPAFTDFESKYVQVGQGFFVLANYNGVTFSFTREMQAHNTWVTMTKSTEKDDLWPGICLRVKSAHNESYTTIVYNEKMSYGLDPGYDVGQLGAGGEIEVSTSLVAKDNGVNFARQALPVADFDKNIVTVGIDCEKGGEVIFSAYSVPFAHYSFWLEDRKTGVFTDLSNYTYTVTLPANTFGTGRFFIYASANMPAGVINPPDVMEVRVWTSNDKVIIKGMVSEIATCEIYDLQGQKVLKSRLTDGELNIVELSSVQSGVFLVRVVDGTKVYNRKIALL
jgi:hypothetical protein